MSTWCQHCRSHHHFENSCPSMIGEKRLDDIEQTFKDMCPFSSGPNDPLAKHDLAELTRLARLGLWAEKQGIPAAKGVLDRMWRGPFSGSMFDNEVLGPLAEAVAALKAVGVKDL